MTTDIRDYRTFHDSLRNYAGWLPRQMSGMSDLDGACERNGWILVVETKDTDQTGETISVPYGQWLLFKALASKRDVNVWLVGNRPDSKFLYVPLIGEVIPTYARQTNQMLFTLSLATAEVLTRRELTDRAEEWWVAASATKREAPGA